MGIFGNWGTTPTVSATILKDNKSNQHLTVDEQSRVTGLSVKLDGYEGNPDDLTISWSCDNTAGTNYRDEGGQFPKLTWGFTDSQNPTLTIPQVFKNWEGKLNVEIKDAGGKKVASANVDVTILNSKNEAPTLEKGMSSGWYYQSWEPSQGDSVGATKKALVGNNVEQAYSGEKVELSFKYEDPNPGDGEHLIFRFEQIEGVEVTPVESRNDYGEFYLSFEAPRVTHPTPVTLRVTVRDSQGAESTFSQSVTITPAKTGHERLDEMARIAGDPSADRFDRRSVWYNLYLSGDFRAASIFASILGEPTAELHLKTHLLDLWMEELGDGEYVKDWDDFRNNPMAVAVRANPQARAFFANQEGMQYYADSLGEPYRPYNFVEVASIMMPRSEYILVLAQFISNRVFSYETLRGSLAFLLEKLDSLDPKVAQALTARIIDEDIARDQNDFSTFDNPSYYLKPCLTSRIVYIMATSTNPYLLRDAMDELRTRTDWEVSDLPTDLLMDPRFAKTDLGERTYGDEESADLWKVTASFAVQMGDDYSIALVLAYPYLEDEKRAFLEALVLQESDDAINAVCVALESALMDWSTEEQGPGADSLARLTP